MMMTARGRPLSFYVLAGLMALLLIFLYAPMLCVYILSFQGPDGGMSFPMVGWSFHWFEVLFEGTGGHGIGDVPNSFRRSVRLAAFVSVLSTVIALSAGMAYRRKFPGSNFVFYSAIAAMVLPGIFIGFGIALTFNLMGWTINWWSSGIGAQLTWSLPFGLLIMFIVLGRFNPAYEEAATDLGANARQRFQMIILPIILPGIVGIFVSSITSSYEENARTQLNVGLGNTMPMEVTGLLTGSSTPVLFAIGTLTSLFMFALILGSVLLMGWMARRRAARSEL
ncbi:ABC transporter permease [Pseudooceanicola nanhaiensis]|jgi:putative spermidine/putrescine transport system permease protein|uniref:ABC transporter permease n=1 Tax=Pseudooceanicola nanhaiensis TaxID=375761 RepID=A0A917SIK9_9RHOB|nr:ABC transporter permease subunit [Pseudooceanicola nanhaiensis]GGL82523.1 ABC transporter permease [Pseudooceanicola nanhaiensis]